MSKGSPHKGSSTRAFCLFLSPHGRDFHSFSLVLFDDVAVVLYKIKTVYRYAGATLQTPQCCVIKSVQTFRADLHTEALHVHKSGSIFTEVHLSFSQ